MFEGRPDPAQIPEREGELAVSLFALVQAMQRVLERVPEAERHHEVQLESLSLRDRMIYIMDRLREHAPDAVLFEDLLLDGAVSRARVVVTFLGLLELARIQALTLFQTAREPGQPDGPIWVRADGQGAPDDQTIQTAADRAERELAERTSLDEPPESEEAN